MMKAKQKFIYPLTLFFVLAAVLLSAVFPSFSTKAYAADTGDMSVVEAYEQRNVLDDLKGSTIGGVPFDLDDWQFNDRGKMQIVSFVEYAYSFYEEKQDDYGLYIYVYNPQGLAINTSSEHNKIQFTYGSNSAPIKPQLEFLNYSTEAGYEGLFFKFKIALSPSQKTAILNNVQQNARVYTVTEFEVSVGGSVTAYTVGSTYTYSGYSEGYGSELATSDTLSCVTDEFDKYIELEVTHTVYRPQGNFYDGQQSQLNSCFFRVPEVYFEDYGELYKVACEWYEYVIKPVLITENWFIYNKLDALHGGAISQVDSNYDFLFLAVGNNNSTWHSQHKEGLGWTSDISLQSSYEWFEGLLQCYIKEEDISPDTFFDRFSAVFYTGGKDYTEYGVSAEQLEQKFLSNSEKLGGSLICDNYSAALFEDFVEEGHTRGYNGNVEVTADESKDIWWNITTKSLWQKMFGGYTVDTEYDSINAIETVEEADLQGTDEEIAARLYIAVSDVSKLKTDFAKAKVLGERVILLRYGNSTYFSAPTAQAYVRSSSVDEPDWALVIDVHKQMYEFAGYGGEGYSAYIAQTTVYLNFDIISLTFRENNVETVIPVVMSPTNAFSGIDTPLEEYYGDDGIGSLFGIILLIILIVLAVLIIGPILWPIIGPVVTMILKAVWWVIAFPFNLIGKLFKKKPKKQAETSPPQVVVVNPTEYNGVQATPPPKKQAKAAKGKDNQKTADNGK